MAWSYRSQTGADQVTGGGPGPLGTATPVTIYQSDPVVLTNAQIKALPTTAIPLVDGIPGNLIAPICAWFYLDWHGDYSNLDAGGSIRIGYTGASSSPLCPFYNASLGDLLQDGASHVSFMGLRSRIINDSESVAQPIPAGVGQFQDEPGVIGEGLELTAVNAPSGDFEDGHADNKLYVVVWYGITDFGGLP